MSARTSIEWTEATWNPTTGCDRTSPGCENCYALTLSKRLKAMGSKRYQVDGDPRTSGPGFRLTIHEDVIDLPKRWVGGRLVFVNSMSDLFHPNVPVDVIRRVFAVMAETPRHTYQVLTKRSRRLVELADDLPWPANVWMGVSVESARYKYRIADLSATPAQVKFLSAEPLLGPLGKINLGGLHWVIVGGESGIAARQMDPDWARDIRDQCTSAFVSFFFKQWGGRTPKAGGRLLDGHDWSEIPGRPTSEVG
jgi:protein gp37